MCFQPKGASGGSRVDAYGGPPSGFVAAAMHLAVMSAAQRHRKFIADLAPKRRCLRKAQVMGIGGTPTADEARMLNNRFDVLPVTNAARLRHCQYAFVDTRDSAAFTSNGTTHRRFSFY
jgi:hypothetical protein